MTENTQEIKKAKIYPNNFEAEKSLLCCMLIDGDAAVDILPQIEEDSFYNERHKRIYRAAHSLYLKNVPIDIITVNDQLEKDKNTDLSMMSYLGELSSYLPSAANFLEYVKILNRDLVLRKLITACNGVIEQAYYSEDETATLAAAEKAIFDIGAGRQQGSLEHVSKASNDLIARIDMMCRDKGSFRGLMTHFPIFDKLTNGLQNGDLIILAARPSVGKTSFALNIVANLVANKDNSKVVAIFSLEMPAVQLAQRLISTAGGITMDSLSRGSLTGQELDNLWPMHAGLSQSKIYIDETAMQTPNNILNRCRRLAIKEKRIDLVIVDYLQLMASDDSRKRSDSKNSEVSDISRLMKLLAREMNCPVIVLSQMSRGIENRDSKIPKLSDLRESGAIEQDADIVMFLSREDENEKSKPEYNVILDVMKHRNGSLGEIRYVWQGENVRFTESKDQYINREIEVKKKGMLKGS